MIPVFVVHLSLWAVGNLLVLAAITGAVVMLVHEHRTAGLTRGRSGGRAMTGRDLAAILAILAMLVLALTMTTASWWSAAQRTITRQQPRCIGCHTHHLPGHDCDGQPLDKTRETA